MRVYRIGKKKAKKEKCSLTASEGISTDFEYIKRLKHVPSLQVRVYRKHGNIWLSSGRSFTASEGISTWAIISLPNCSSLTASEGISLGYIISVIVFRCKCSVPSLYVRVYRPVRSPQKFARGFLTICKGVSPGSAHTSMMPSFPHCM